MVVSLIALFVALSGTGYAAVTLKKNSVGSPQIKRGAVKTSDLANNAVTSPKVKDGSLLASDFKSGELPAGAAGAQGAKGDTGTKGDTGAAGPTAAAKASEDISDTYLGSATNVMELDKPSVGSGKLHMTFSGRVVTNATVQFRNWAVSGQIIECHIARMNASDTASVENGQFEWQSLAASAYDTLSLNAAFDIPAGDYNFRVVCTDVGGGTTNVTANDATLTAIAAAN